MSSYNELKKADMAFKLEDGHVILISKEDIQEIAMKIIVEGSLNKMCVFVSEKDMSIEKANILYNILRTEKDIKPSIRDKYLSQIGMLLSTRDIKYTDFDGAEVEIVNSSETK